jgi:hypothetical protein
MSDDKQTGSSDYRHKSNVGGPEDARHMPRVTDSDDTEGQSLGDLSEGHRRMPLGVPEDDEPGPTGARHKQL